MKLIASIMVTSLFVAVAQAQSVADLARQERAKKAGAEAKIKITNDTVKTSTATPPSIVGKSAETPAAAAASPASKPVGPVDRNGRDEKWWRTAFAEVRAEAKRAEDQIKVLQLKLNQANIDYLQKSDLYNREMRLAAEITAIKADFEAEQRKAEAAQKKLDELEDELRRSGGPPGWAR